MTIHHDKMAYGKLASAREEISQQKLADMVSELNCAPSVKRVYVVGACFIENGTLFAVRRSYGNDQVIHKYEFVGGKREPNESDEQALMRECREEMALNVQVGELIATVDHDYPDKKITLAVYRCQMKSDFILKEHEEYRWLVKDQIHEDEWAPADAPILSVIKQTL